MAILGDYIEQIRGVSYKPEDVCTAQDKDAVAIFRANNIQDDGLNFDDLVYVKKSKVSAIQYIKAGDIVVCASSGSKNLVGKAAIATEDMDFSFGAFCKVVRPRKLLPSYVGHYFQSPKYRNKISELAGGANINNIRNEHIDELDIVVPNTDEQERISIELNKICYLISLRKQQLSKLDKLVKSRFVELFGDPMTNSNGYVLKKYGDLFELNAGGTPSKQQPKYWDNGSISWIGSNMCQNTVIYENDGNYITEEGLKHSSARIFPVDTVLIALVGATIGKTALLKFETTTNQNVLGVRGIRESGYTPEFIFHYTQGLYQKFLNIGDGGFAMASKGFISELPVPVVDLALQEQFAAFVEQTDKSKLAVQQSLEKLETLKKSLMQQYFG